MNEYSLFRLKLQYKAENQETGEIEKAKMEILAQCVNYTDAETLVNKLIEQYQMDKLDPCNYEIVKGKFDVSNIVGTPVLQHDNKDVLTCGLLQHFFSENEDGLYAVDTIVFGDKAKKEKDVKTTYYIPANDAGDAQSRAMKILLMEGNQSGNCLVSCVKLDNAEYIYLRPQTSANLEENANRVFNGL